MWRAISIIKKFRLIDCYSTNIWEVNLPMGLSCRKKKITTLQSPSATGVTGWLGPFLILWSQIILSHYRTSLIGHLACEFFFRRKMRREQISFNVVVGECAEAEGIRNEPSHPVTPVADGDCKVTRLTYCVLHWNCDTNTRFTAKSALFFKRAERIRGLKRGYFPPSKTSSRISRQFSDCVTSTWTTLYMIILTT